MNKFKFSVSAILVSVMMISSVAHAKSKRKDPCADLSPELMKEEGVALTCAQASYQENFFRDMVETFPGVASSFGGIITAMYQKMDQHPGMTPEELAHSKKWFRRGLIAIPTGIALSYGTQYALEGGSSFSQNTGEIKGKHYAREARTDDSGVRPWGKQYPLPAAPVDAPDPWKSDGSILIRPSTGDSLN